MSDTFTLTITDTDTGHVRLTAVVHVDATGTHLVTVRTATSGAQVPQGLAELDFADLIATAAAPRSPDPAPPASTVSAGSARPRATEPTPAVPARVHRQVPEIPPVPSDFGVTYWRLGSVAKVARHYDVPHRTAQAWIKALQHQGKLANPWPVKKTRPLRPRQ
ncbi:hypothetical protein [Nocardia terpenica]|uniref:Helix-turn-helix domain-containing protein n=1 Tax=Nocardia terpenica TaxID=455432 RepID=A0A6G9ZDH4_9NOCA|nr:hypothetical protein [Nocardia terpenica]QIS23397.1 hypothetical protein F6W96_38750 [Nocardia terpenica]